MRHLSANGIRPHESGKVPGQCVSVWPCQRCCACAKACSSEHIHPAAVRPLRVKPSLPPKSCRRPLPLFPLTQLSCVLPHNTLVHFKFLFRCHHLPLHLSFLPLGTGYNGRRLPCPARCLSVSKVFGAVILNVEINVRFKVLDIATPLVNSAIPLFAAWASHDIRPVANVPPFIMR